MFYDIYPDQEFPEKEEKKQHFDAIKHNNFLNTDESAHFKKYAILSKSSGDILNMRIPEKPAWAMK